jgi:hypothetical protein
MEYRHERAIADNVNVRTGSILPESVKNVFEVDHEC